MSRFPLPLLLVALVCLLPTPAPSQQVSYFNQGFLRQPSAQADRDYLGITTNTGSGSVTNFKAGNLSPLFSTSVTDPTTFPFLQFSLTSQSANTVFAGPAAGGAAAPTFRSLVIGDLPPVVTSITDAPQPLVGSSLIKTYTGPVPSIKSLSVGGGITLSDNGSTITLTSGTNSAGTDINMLYQTAYDGATNFNIDFSYLASTIQSTGDIAFNYSTNWGLSGTSRVANVYVPFTNIYRKILFLNAATNWHNEVRPITGVPAGYSAKISVQLFGVGETNVVYTPYIDQNPTGTNWLIPTFNPTNSQGGCVLWLEASQGMCQDEFGLNPTATGLNVRSGLDLSGFAGRLTNVNVNCGMFYRGPNDSPDNIPALNMIPGVAAWLVSPTFASQTQPNWCFMLWRGRGQGFGMLDGLSEAGGRFSCIPAESSASAFQVYGGSSLVATSINNINWRLFTFSENGANSVIRTNGVQVVSGNAGTQTPARWTVGSDYPLSVMQGNCYLAEILVYHTNLTALQVTNVENYFRTKYKSW